MKFALGSRTKDLDSVDPIALTVFFVPGTEFLGAKSRADGRSPSTSLEASDGAAAGNDGPLTGQPSQICDFLKRYLCGGFHSRHDGSSKAPDIRVEVVPWHTDYLAGGSNLETERLKGVTTLVETILKLGDRPYAVIGHSHGGSIAYDAVVKLAGEKNAEKQRAFERCRGIFTVGTPLISLQGWDPFSENIFSGLAALVGPTWRQFIAGTASVAAALAAFDFLVANGLTKNDFIIAMKSLNIWNPLAFLRTFPNAWFASFTTVISLILFVFALGAWIFRWVSTRCKVWRLQSAEKALNKTGLVHHLHGNRDEIVELLVGLSVGEKALAEGFENLLRGYNGQAPRNTIRTPRFFVQFVTALTTMLLRNPFVAFMLTLIVMGAVALAAANLAFLMLLIISGVLALAVFFLWRKILGRKILGGLASAVFRFLAFGMTVNQRNFFEVTRGERRRVIREKLPSDVLAYLNLAIARDQLAKRKSISEFINELPKNIEEGSYPKFEDALQHVFLASWPGHASYFRSRVFIAYLAKLVAESCDLRLRSTLDFDRIVEDAKKIEREELKAVVDKIELPLPGNDVGYPHWSGSPVGESVSSGLHSRY